MKKATIVFVIFFLGLMATGCDRQEMVYQSEPVGYGLVGDIYVAKGAFHYRSDQPFNPNAISLERYYLPSVWGEIELGEDQELASDDPNVIIIDFNTLSQKVFAKYIHVGESTWTAELDGTQVIYVNQSGDDIRDILLDESEAKAYIEALDAQNAYFLNDERVTLSGYVSKLDTPEADDVFQKISTVQVVNILWAETLSAFPDLATHFPDYDGDDINALFARAYAKADELEYRTGVFIK